LRLASGRRVSWRAYGPDDGAPVLVMHGTFTGSLIPEVVAGHAEQAGVRLICADRPGYGWSDRSDGVAGVVAAARETRDLAETMGLSAYGVLTLGLGAAYGIELCRDNPAAQRLVMCSPSFGGAALPGQKPQPVTAVSRQLRKSAQWFTDNMLRALMDNVTRQRAVNITRKSMTWSEADRALIEGHGLDEFFADASMDARQHPIDGVIFDWAAVGAWPVEPDAATCPTHLLFGADDITIRTAQVAALYANVTQADVHQHPGEGHLFYFSRWADVLARARG
jgi:pimeloyl-ACP methyl ester carboxylesterase